MITDVNLNLYRVFYVLATSKTFLEASEKLYISQPAVSKNIKILEETLKIKLFHRDNTGLKLTNDGKELLEYIEKSYNILVAGQRKLIDSRDLKHGNIIIGAPSHIASFYLMKFIKQFHKEYPGIFIKIINAPTVSLLDELQQHKIDFIIDSSPIECNFSNCIIEKLVSFETCFITNDRNLLYQNLEKYEYIMPTERSTIRKNLEKVLKKNKKNLKVVLEVETTGLIIDAVKNGMGIGYVIKESILDELKNEKLFIIDNNYELPKVELNLVYGSDDLTISAKKFINEYIKNNFYNKEI